MTLKKQIIHLHHIATHFTNGLFPVSSVLLTMFLINNDPTFESASFYCLVFGTCAIPIAYATGFYDWRTRFQGRRTQIFDHKSVLGVIFFVVAIGEIVLRTMDIQIMFGQTGIKWIFVGINYLLTGCAGYLGYLGGKFI